MSRRVFISHAADDESLVDDLKTMLVSGVGLNPTEIFYSSGAGTGIPAGKNFVQHVRDAMEDATFVIVVITPAYLESEFCLAELGAVWYASDKDFYPVCVPTVDRPTLKATLTGTQVDKLDDLATLSDLLQRLCLHFERNYVAAACAAQAQIFLAALPGLLEDLGRPTKVPAERVLEVEAVRDNLVGQLAKARDDYRGLEQRYADLEVAKTADEIAAIAPVGDVNEQVASLIDAAQTAVYRLSSTVKKALPYALKEEGMPWPDAGDYKHQAVGEAVDDGFLRDGDDGFVYVNTEWPDIEEAVGALTEVQSFLRRLNEHEDRWFRNTYGVPPDLRQGAAFEELF